MAGTVLIVLDQGRAFRRINPALLKYVRMLP